MAKSWSDVSASPEFQALSDDDKEAARVQYFESVVAPQVGEDEVEEAWSQFDAFSRPAKAQPKIQPQRESTAGAGRGEASFAAADPRRITTQPSASVGRRFRGEAPPADALQEQQVVGDVTPSMLLDTPRRPGLEDQADLQQMSRSPAAKAAELKTASDETARAKFLRDSGELKPVPERGVIDRALDATLAKPLDRSLAGLAVESVGDAVRGIGRASQGLGSSVWSGIQAGAESVGADGLAQMAGASARAGREAQDRLANPNDPNSLTQQIFESTFTSVPLVAGLGASAGLGAMMAQSAADDYGRSRERGLTHAEALPRAAWMGIAEGVGERFGLPQLSALFSGAIAKAGPAQFGKILADLVWREQAGEQVTLALQNAYEATGPQGLKPNLTLEQYLKEAADTAIVTAGQSLLTGGLAAGAKRLAGQAQAAPSAIDIARSKGFLGGVSFTPPDSEVARAGITPVVAPAAPAGAPQVDPIQAPPAPGITPPAAGRPDFTKAMAAVDDRQAADAQAEVAPAATWTGRRGAGYVNQADAEQALEGRRRRQPELDWRAEQREDGNFELRGYMRRAEGEANVEQQPATKPRGTDLVGQPREGGGGVAGGQGRGDGVRAGIGLGPQPVAGAAEVGAAQDPGTGVTAGQLSQRQPISIPSEVVASDLRRIQDYRLKRGEVTKLRPSDSDTQAEAVAVASAFGIPVVVVKDVNGAANFSGVAMDKGRIYINEDAPDAPLKIAVHEIVHTLPAGIRNALVERAMLYTTKELKDKFLWKYDGYKDKTEAEQNEEMVAMFAQDDAKTPEFWETLRSKLGDRDFAGLAKHILSKLNQLMSMVRRGDDRKFFTDISAVRDLVTEALARAERGETYWRDDLEVGGDGGVDVTEISAEDAGFSEMGRKDTVGDFEVRLFKDGGMEVRGDADDIRSRLPDDVKGRVTDSGVRFTTSDAARVRAALEGRGVAYSRAGQVINRLPMKNGKYLGAPPDYDTPAKITKLRRILRQLAEEGAQGRFWYENSSAAVLHMVGGNKQEARKFVALLAIYSPQAKVDANSTFALRAWAQYKAGHPISVKTAVMDRKAAEALADVDKFWSGEKTGNFFHNLLREIDESTAGQQGATIDMWMMRAGQYPGDAPTKTQYAFMEHETNRLARDLGWEPQQVQAAIWVAMKARMENDGVKKRTEAKSEKRGWIRFERNAKGKKVRVVIDKQKHRDNWLQTAMEHDVTKKDTATAKFDFADGIRRHVGQISFEARPGRTTGVLPGIHSAPYAQQLEFQQAVQKAFYDDETGEDMLAAMLGLLVDDVTTAPGVWEGDVSPSSQLSTAMAPAKGKAGKSAVDDAQKKLLNVYAAVAGLVARQEGVGWHRPFYASTKAKANGVDIDIGRPINPQEAADLERAIGSWMEAHGHDKWYNDFAIVSSPRGVRLLNFGVISNQELHNELRLAAEVALPDYSYRVFASDGGMAQNSWKESPNGQGYVQGIGAAGRSDVLDWARAVLAPRVQDVFRDFSERYEWGDPGTLDFSEDGRDRGRRDQGRGPAPLAGAPSVEGATGPDPRLVDAAERYARGIGIDLKRQSVYVDVDEARAKRLAAAYAAMPHAPQDPRVREAYENLIRQTRAQYDALVDAGYRFWFMDPAADPYQGNPWNAMRDLRANQRMAVYPTEAGFGSGATDVNVDDNPLLADTGVRWPSGSQDGPSKRVLANDLFRAVHDAFGHGLEGAGFRARGEENAWQAHVRLFTGSAVGALTSETRGQNSWLNYGPYGDRNRDAKVEDTVFADQKTGLMPEWTWTEGRLDDVKFSEEPATARDVAKAAKSMGVRLDVTEGPRRIDLLMIERTTGAPGAGGDVMRMLAAYADRKRARIYLDLKAGAGQLGNYYSGFGFEPIDRVPGRPEWESGMVRQPGAAVTAATSAGASSNSVSVVPSAAGGYVVIERVGRGRREIGRADTEAEAQAIADRAGDIQFSESETPWYSALSRAIEKGPAQAPADQWRAFLKGLPSKGVKQDEITWSGIEEWLKLQTGKVSRQAVLEYLNANGVKVTETVLGAQDRLLGREADEALYEWVEENGNLESPNFRPEWQEFYDSVLGGDTSEESLAIAKRLNVTGVPRDLIQGAYDGFLPGANPDPKYGQYTLPGGTRYREVLLTLPERRPLTEYWRDMADKYGDSDPRTIAAKKAARAEAGMNAPKPYKSSHWDQPNVLAHIRLNDRTDADGKRVLFVEEIQSDWGQEGKKKGFASESDTKPVSRREYDKFIDKMLDDYIARGVAAGESRQAVERRGVNMQLSQMAAELGRADEYERMRAGRLLEQSGESGRGVPPAPFVTKTDSWLGLALKRVIHMAATEGYDRVAFVTGEQSAERYDLSKQVDDLRYGDGMLVALKGGAIVVNKEAKPEDLPDIVGKEVADRLLKAPEMPGNGYRRLTGLDLKVGGEGMKAFYDVIVPNAVKGLLKKVGGSKVETVAIANEDRARKTADAEARQLPDSHLWGVYLTSTNEWLVGDDGVTDNPNIAGAYSERAARSAADAMNRTARDLMQRPYLEQPGFDITPAMREAAGGGMPMFSDYGKEKERFGRKFLPGQRQPRTPRLSDLAVGSVKSEATVNAMTRAIDSEYPIINAARKADSDVARAWKIAVEALPGRTADATNQAHKELIEPLVVAMGKAAKSLKMDSAQLIDAYGIYRLAKHAPERNDTLRANGSKKANPSGMSEAEASQWLSFFRGEPDLLRALQSLDPLLAAIQKRTDDVKLAAGLLTQEDIDARSGWDWYISLRGDPGADETGGSRGSGGWNNDIDPRARGRDSLSANPVINTVKMLENAIRLAEMARVKKATYDMAEAHPDILQAKITRIVNRPYFNEDGDFARAFPNTDRFSDDSIVYRNGDVEYKIEIGDGKVVGALKGLENRQMDPVVRGFGKLTSALGRLFTQFSPHFPLVNFIRDLQQQIAYIAGSDIVIGGKKVSSMKAASMIMSRYPKTFAAAVSEVIGRTPTGKYTRMARELHAAGGMSGFSKMFSDEEALKEFTKRVQWKAGKAVSSLAWNKFVDFVADVSEVFEMTTRLAAYSTMRDMGMPVDESANWTKNLMNFSKAGTSVRGFLGNFYMFLKPSIQDVYLTSKLLRTKKGGIVMGAAFVGAMALYAMLRELSGDDDEDPRLKKMDKRNASERRAYYILPYYGPDGNKPLRIPVGFGLPRMAWGLAVTTVDGIMNPDFGAEDVADGAFKSMASSLSPMQLSENNMFTDTEAFLATTFAPTLALPIIELAMNKSKGGTTLVRDSKYQQLPDYATDFSSTPKEFKDAAKWMYDSTGGKVDVHPETLQHLLRSWGGGPAGVALNALQSGERQRQGDDISRRDIPIVQAFTGAPDRYPEKRFRDLSKKVDSVMQQIKDSELRGTPLSAELQAKHENLLAIKKAVDDLERREGKKVAEIRQLYRDNYAEAARATRELEREMRAEKQAVVDAYNELEGKKK